MIYLIKGIFVIHLLSILNEGFIKVIVINFEFFNF